MTALAASDLFFRWTPGVDAHLMRIHHVGPGANPNVSPPARFAGFPPAASPAGTVIAEDNTSRFIAVMAGFLASRWHRDVDWTLGVPAVDKNVIYMPVGGPGATRGLVAMDGATGVPGWMFAPDGIARDPSRVMPVIAPLTAYLAPASVRKRLANSGDVPQTAGFGTNASRPVITQDQLQPVQLPVKVPQATSLLAPGHWTNAGVVVSDGRVFAEVNHSIVALDQRTGSPVWRHALDQKAMVHSLVATPEHLLFCVSITRKGDRIPVWEIKTDDTEDMLVALRLDNGKLAWQQTVPRPGNLALAGGMLYFADGDLHAFGPAERTYDLAANSDRPQDYRPAGDEAPVGTQAGCEPLPADGPAQPAPGPAKAAADASILRLTYGDPAADMLRRARQRRQLTAGVPLVISLDWLTPDRSQVIGGAWTPQRIAEFASLVEQLSREGLPAHFDVAPDVNLYLARNPSQLDTVRSLVRAAASAAHRGSGGARVLISLNVETLTGSYGRGTHLPYGPAPKRPPNSADVLTLLSEVDEVGLTTTPQAAFAQAGLMPADYLLSLRKHLQRKPVLVTRISVRVDGKSPREVAEQAAFLPELQQQCYWLDAPVVVRPEAAYTAPPSWPREARVKPEEILQRAGIPWHAWKRVSRLTLELPEDVAAVVGPQALIPTQR